jgi:hypothetical protein
MKKNSALSALLVGSSVVAMAAMAAPGVDEVGDPDSFGNNVIYLGIAQTPGISLLDDCTPDPMYPPDPDSRCITLKPQPLTTTFDEGKLDYIKLPGGATKTLICFAVTPSMNFQFNNLTGADQPSARFVARPVITIESDVLNDPGLIDPSTGLPLSGRIVLPLSTYSESRSLEKGERAQKQMFLSRSCIGGLVSRRSLIDNYGLSDAQADTFFAKEITLILGASGSAQLVDYATYFYGIRLYGDR